MGIIYFIGVLMGVLETIPLVTESGEVECSFFESGNGETCLLISKKPWTEPTFVRLHSACMFGESIHSIDCDCALQLDAALKLICGEEGGVIVYLFQEGRGIGLLGKMQAIKHQLSKNIDTAKAFAELGHLSDVRNYVCAAEALSAIGVPRAIKLATNNPQKIAQMESLGFKVIRIPLDIQITSKIESYLTMKRESLGHL